MGFVIQKVLLHEAIMCVYAWCDVSGSLEQAREVSRGKISIYKLGLGIATDPLNRFRFTRFPVWLHFQLAIHCRLDIYKTNFSWIWKRFYNCTMFALTCCIIKSIHVYIKNGSQNSSINFSFSLTWPHNKVQLYCTDSTLTWPWQFFPRQNVA